MKKPTLLYVSPIASRSGYGEHAREVAKFLLQLHETYELKFTTVGWGENPLTGLDDNKEITQEILSRISLKPTTQTPDVYIQMGLPFEFKPMGNYNIGITAGIESTKCPESFINGCNCMDLLIVPSEFTKQTLLNSKYEHEQEMINRLTSPVEVIPQTLDTEVFGYDKTSECSELNTQLKDIEESFCFLFVGQWNPMPNHIGGRKNVATMITNFIDTFLDYDTPPALILKTHGTNFSHIDQKKIKELVGDVTKNHTKKIPNIYLIHGDLTQEELNNLYNHDKVKCHISYSSGEGFCRPLLEASASGRPVIASKWSGHLDFLPKSKSILLPGTLVEPNINNNMFPPDCKWFEVDTKKSSELLTSVYDEYDKHLIRAKKLADTNLKKYNSSQVFDMYSKVFDTYIPKQPDQVEIQLPTIHKINE